MNVETGKIVKATYNSALHKLTFKSDEVGQFVVLKKVKGKTVVNNSKKDSKTKAKK